jgi:hypothetical protein
MMIIIYRLKLILQNGGLNPYCVYRLLYNF